MKNAFMASCGYSVGSENLTNVGRAYLRWTCHKIRSPSLISKEVFDTANASQEKC